MSDFEDYLNKKLEDPAFRREFVKQYPAYLLKQVTITLGIAVRRVR